MGFRAVVVDRDAEGRTHAAVREIELGDLPEGEVTVAVEYSTLNYKDGLCLGPGAGLVRRYPHVPGIDFAGRVEASEDPRYRPGDPVVLTGWRVGEAHWGGYAGEGAGQGRLAGAAARGADACARRWRSAPPG